MRLSDVSNEHITLLLGAPRSGTTWLGKLFDSHPDVLYRHEPDTVLRDNGIPGICTSADVPLYKAAAAAYLRRLIDVRTLKSAGSLPVFPKSFESRMGRAVRQSMIYGLRAAEQFQPARHAARKTEIPDMMSAGSNAGLRVVMKSVSSRGRARLFAEALPGCRIVFLLRNPCGQVASMMRGATMRMFESRVPLDEMLATTQASRYGLTARRLASMTPVEQFTWHWAVLNEKAIADLEAAPNARIIRYQDLADDTVNRLQGLFAFVGLSWHPQTQAFIEASTQAKGRDRYYQVFKNTAESAKRWRTAFARDDMRRIVEVVRATPLWSFCPELEEYAA